MVQKLEFTDSDLVYYGEQKENVMRYEWTDGHNLSILRVESGDILYVAEIHQMGDGDFWFYVYMDSYNTDYGRDTTRDGAKRLAETSLTELIGQE